MFLLSPYCRDTVFFTAGGKKNVKPLQFLITPAKLLSPFRGQLAFDLLWAPEPLNGATRPNTGLDRPILAGAVYWQFIGSFPESRKVGISDRASRSFVQAAWPEYEGKVPADELGRARSFGLQRAARQSCKRLCVLVPGWLI
jgi:hypothetical protein